MEFETLPYSCPLTSLPPSRVASALPGTPFGNTAAPIESNSSGALRADRISKAPFPRKCQKLRNVELRQCCNNWKFLCVNILYSLYFHAASVFAAMFRARDVPFRGLWILSLETLHFPSGNVFNLRLHPSQLLWSPCGLHNRLQRGCD